MNIAHFWKILYSHDDFHPSRRTIPLMDKTQVDSPRSMIAESMITSLLGSNCRSHVYIGDPEGFRENFFTVWMT